MQFRSNGAVLPTVRVLLVSTTMLLHGVTIQIYAWAIRSRDLLP